MKILPDVIERVAAAARRAVFLGSCVVAAVVLGIAGDFAGNPGVVAVLGAFRALAWLAALLSACAFVFHLGELRGRHPWLDLERGGLTARFKPAAAAVVAGAFESIGLGPAAANASSAIGWLPAFLVPLAFLGGSAILAYDSAATGLLRLCAAEAAGVAQLYNKPRVRVLYGSRWSLLILGVVLFAPPVVRGVFFGNWSVVPNLVTASIVAFGSCALWWVCEHFVWSALAGGRVTERRGGWA